MRTIGIIPARAASRGILRKNKRIMNKQPLIAWTIQAAQMAKSIDEVVVSTDDPEIAEISRNLGIAVPYLRPPELAQDDTPAIEPVKHALSLVHGFESVVVLQPTSPLRTAADIDGAAELAKSAPSVVSVCATQEPIQWTYTIEEGGSLRSVWLGDMAARRQEALATYTLNGAIYFCDISWLLASGKLVNEQTIPYIMPPERSIDIDTDFDWMLAEFLLSRLK